MSIIFKRDSGSGTEFTEVEILFSGSSYTLDTWHLVQVDLSVIAADLPFAAGSKSYTATPGVLSVSPSTTGVSVTARQFDPNDLLNMTQAEQIELRASASSGSGGIDQWYDVIEEFNTFDA